MSKVGDIERTAQNRIVRLFQSKELDYTYLGNWEERENNSNIEVTLLRKYLQERGYSESLISKAIRELLNTCMDLSKGLYSTNKEVYSMLRYGIKVKEEIGTHAQTVYLIDWKNRKNNNFYVAEEVTVKGDNTKRPDIVLYVNGIALGVIELKRSTVSTSEGIRQSIGNQRKDFIEHFFPTIQMIMAGNDTEGIKYGTIKTPEKYYLSWKEDLKSENPIYTDIENVLDKHIFQMCNKERFLEFIHDFIVFDAGVKKLCRPNQYFGVKAAQKKLNKNEGGIIWHTQGSGKSLTMVWLTKWLKEFNPQARILIITDREELDEQIERVFSDVGESIRRTTSGKDLLEVLNKKEDTLICSLIHKFGRKTETDDYDEYIKEIEANLPSDFSAKGDIYVFVDECHRTQSGKLHRAMKTILPENVVFVGFTGTPLLKDDKETSLEIFGGYIHTYKFNEAVEDKVVLDLLYEARDVNQFITAQDKIDTWFEAKTRGLTENAKTELKKKWGTMQKVLSSRSRLEKIVADILMDMATKDRLCTDTGTAILIAGGIPEACKYYELFLKSGFKKCAIITSYVPMPSDIKLEDTGEDGETVRAEQFRVYQEMLNGQEIETFEKEAKRKFIDEPAQMKLLIVVDKLLTGFDAPSATYLYIDKNMQDHGLFQAICRVNRLDGESKEYGYIIDYKDLFNSLKSAIQDYTTEVFAKYDKKDVEGLIKNRIVKAKEDLDAALSTIKLLCEGVEEPKTSELYRKYFIGDDPESLESIKRRTELYKYTSGLIRSYVAVAEYLEAAGYSSIQVANIKKDVKFYEQLRQEIKLASGDYIDLKSYEPDMRYLIDTYINAEESRLLSNFDDMTLIELIVQRGEDAIDSLPKNIKKDRKAVAETIENNIRKVVNSEYLTNPKYYEKMSILLEEIIKARKEEALAYEAYLSRIIELAKVLKSMGNASDYPAEIKTQAQKALYDNLGQNKELAINLHSVVIKTKKDNWKGNKFKERELKKAIEKLISDEKELEHVFELIKNQNEYN